MTAEKKGEVGVSEEVVVDEKTPKQVRMSEWKDEFMH